VYHKKRVVVEDPLLVVDHDVDEHFKRRWPLSDRFVRHHMDHVHIPSFRLTPFFEATEHSSSALCCTSFHNDRHHDPKAHIIHHPAAIICFHSSPDSQLAK
jgi:hypothetical protein